MPKKNKNLCVDDLRHAEYYDMQDTFDELYQRSLSGDTFESLMEATQQVRTTGISQKSGECLPTRLWRK